MDTFFCQRLQHMADGIAQGSEGQQQYFFTLLQELPFPNRQHLRFIVPVKEYASTARVTDDERKSLILCVLIGGDHHVAQLVFVQRGGDDQVGDAAQEGQIESALVRGAVLADQSCTVYAENNWQFL